MSIFLITSPSPCILTTLGDYPKPTRPKLNPHRQRSAHITHSPLRLHLSPCHLLSQRRPTTGGQRSPEEYSHRARRDRRQTQTCRSLQRQPGSPAARQRSLARVVILGERRPTRCVCVPAPFGVSLSFVVHRTGGGRRRTVKGRASAQRIWRSASRSRSLTLGPSTWVYLRGSDLGTGALLPAPCVASVLRSLRVLT